MGTQQMTSDRRACVTPHRSGLLEEQDLDAFAGGRFDRVGFGLTVKEHTGVARAARGWLCLRPSAAMWPRPQAHG